MNILLFDIDGVLIEDGGYYAALVKTLDLLQPFAGRGPDRFQPARSRAIPVARLRQRMGSVSPVRRHPADRNTGPPSRSGAHARAV